jgi:cytochrome b561
MNYPWTFWTRLFHGLLALSVVIQVGLILIRESIDHHGTWANARPVLITIHQWNGWIVLVLLLLYAWSKGLGRSRTLWLQFFPVTHSAVAKIREDIQLLFKGQLPFRMTPKSLGGLSGLVQGLGLLLVLGLAVIGGLAMLGWHQLGVPESWSHSLIQIHKALAVLIWWYLGGHIGMALIHWILPKKFQRSISE